MNIKKSALFFVIVLVMSLFFGCSSDKKSVDESNSNPPAWVEDRERVWTKLADMPESLIFPAAVAFEERIYVFGNNVSEYNPLTDSWVKKSELPTKRIQFRAIACSGKIYIIGGRVENGKVLNIIEEYDPKNDMWTEKANMPVAKQLFGAVEVNGKIYTFGGDSINANPNSAYSVEEYDPKLDKWTEKTKMKSPKHNAYAVSAGSVIYVISDKIEEYCYLNDTWQEMSDIPFKGCDFGVEQAIGKIYFIGGSNPPLLLNSVNEFDPSQNEWLTKKSMGFSRTAIGTVTLADEIYVLGGFTGSGASNGFEVYNPMLDK